MTAGPTPVTTSVEDGVAVVRLDDGKVNAISYAVIEALSEALDRAREEASAVCIVGRPGQLSAGFDLSVMRSGVDAARDLVAAGGAMMMRLFLHPQPVAVAVTGNAVAAGALLVLCCDVRVGTDGPARIGLNETSIGMPLPQFAVELARDRLTPRAVTRATLGAEMFGAREGVEAGYLDRVVPPGECENEAVAEARRLGGYEAAAYARTKEVLRQDLVARVRAGGAEDLARFTT